MSDKDYLKLEWWRLCCEKSNEPIAFVDLEDRFVFCNNAWSRLTGYNESELIGKKWQDITDHVNVGADQRGTEDIKSGKRDEYYIEKKYIKKDTSIIGIKLYVHRFPEHGGHEGYIVFAQPVSSEEYEDLKQKFLNIQKDVLLLQQSKISNDIMSNQMKMLEQKLEQNHELAKIALDKRNSSSRINIGDSISGRDRVTKAGGDFNMNSGNVNITIISIVVVTIITFLGMGLGVLYLLLK